MRLTQFAIAVLMLVLGSALRADSGDDEESEFTLRIEAGQYSALIGRASDAVDIVFADDKGDSDVDDKCGAGVKATALELLDLRNKLAGKKHLLPSQALRLKWPAWVFAPPTECPTPAEIRRRLDWLGTQVLLVTNPICGAAEAKTGDTLICSVE